MRISDWSSDVCSSDLAFLKDRFVLVDYEESGPTGQRTFVGRIAIDGEERSVSGRGNGLISSVVVALRDACGVALDVADYNEHAIGQGSDVAVAAYLECTTPDGRTVFGVEIGRAHV